MWQAFNRGNLYLLITNQFLIFPPPPTPCPSTFQFSPVVPNCSLGSPGLTVTVSVKLHKRLWLALIQKQKPHYSQQPAVLNLINTSMK